MEFDHSHNPTLGAWSTQYKAALWVHSDHQREAAEASRAQIAEQKTGRWFNKTIKTEILPAQTFYLAEDYHQAF